MALFRKMRERFHDDWCSVCTEPMEVVRKQLYAMPGQLVGHYVAHSEPEYYMGQGRLIPVERKAEIPTGMYACGMIAYRCPQCGHRAVKVSIFLPVREEEKAEQNLYFERGELDALLWAPEGEGRPLVPKTPETMEAKRVTEPAYYT